MGEVLFTILGNFYFEFLGVEDEFLVNFGHFLLADFSILNDIGFHF